MEQKGEAAPGIGGIRAGAFWPQVALPALVAWMGVHVVRTYAGVLAWVWGPDLGYGAMIAVLAAVWGLGLSGWIFYRPARARLAGILFALCYVAGYALSGQYLTPALAALATIAWLWLLPAAAGVLWKRHQCGGSALSGILLGLAGQVSLQAATHGLDLPMLRGLFPGLGALALAGLLLVALFRATPAGACAEPGVSPEVGSPGWGLIGLGPFLALQMLVLANLGQVGSWSGLGLTESTLLILAGLIGAALLLAWAAPWWLRPAGGLIALALLSQPTLFEGWGALLLLPVQYGLALALPALLAPDRLGQRLPVKLVGALSTLIGILLLLEYGEHASPPGFWLIMAALTILPSLLPAQAKAPVGSGRPALLAAVAMLLLGAAGVGVGLVGHGGGAPATGKAPTGLTLMTYNIHEGYNSFGVPGPEAIARLVDGAKADLITLQEVSRGVDVIGGADLVAWMRWRFPQYYLYYVGANGDRVGHVVLSRYPVSGHGKLPLPAKAATEQRAVNYVVVPTKAGDLLFMGAHLSAAPEEAADRLAQMTEALKFWAMRPHAVLAGDLNEDPGGSAVRLIMRGRWVEQPSLAGLRSIGTYPAHQPVQRLDYIFTTNDIHPVDSRLIESTASDHLPLISTVDFYSIG